MALCLNPLPTCLTFASLKTAFILARNCLLLIGIIRPDNSFPSICYEY